MLDPRIFFRRKLRDNRRTAENSYKYKVRTMFLSDLHLGTRTCQAEQILEFLRTYHADKIYLVGDIIDMWSLEKTWFWPASHEEVLEALFDKVAAGCSVIYIPGNHDAFLRQYAGRQMRGMRLKNAATHVTANGRRFFISHGDQFEAAERDRGWLTTAGDAAYDTLIALNAGFNRMRTMFGLRYWSLSEFVKARVRFAANFIHGFEAALAAEAGRCRYDGIICGHIHHASIRSIDGIKYVNTGDWIENRSAAIERYNGRLELVQSV